MREILGRERVYVEMVVLVLVLVVMVIVVAVVLVVMVVTLKASSCGRLHQDLDRKTSSWDYQ